MPTHSQFPSAETSRTHTYARAALQCGPIPFRNTHHLYTSEHARRRARRLLRPRRRLTRHTPPPLLPPPLRRRLAAPP